MRRVARIIYFERKANHARRYIFLRLASLTGRVEHTTTVTVMVTWLLHQRIKEHFAKGLVAAANPACALRRYPNCRRADAELVGEGGWDEGFRNLD